MTEPVESRLIPCFDPECEGIAEPEQDGDLLYFACTVCGSEFGWERIVIQTEPACQLGIPEDIRRAAMRNVPGLDGAPKQGTPVTLGRKGA